MAAKSSRVRIPPSPPSKPNFNDEKWQIAVDVETDLYNMCLLNLDKEALRNYKFSGLEKYQR